MNAKDTFLSVLEVAKLLDRSKQAIQAQCKAGKYVFRQVPAGGGKGGLKYEIALSSLPQSTQDKYFADLVAARMAQAESSDEVPSDESPAANLQAGTLATTDQSTAVATLSPEKLDDNQRLVNNACTWLIDFIDTYPGTEQKAIDYLNTGYADGSLDTRLQAAMRNCNARPTADRIGHLSRNTVQKWRARFKDRGTYAPLKTQTKDLSVKPWHAAAIALKQRPQGLTLTAIVEALAREFRPPPSYDQVRRFFAEKFSQGEQLEGRWTGMQLRAKQRYTQRSTADLLPWDELHADGWTTHFTAPHPVTGEYVTYELWDVHDLATRFVPPMSVGMRENFEVIFKAIENAVRAGGVPSILQTDSTKIVKAGERFKNNPATALQDRLGMTIVHPKAVGNAQANGMAENFHTFLDREARLLATYQHERMDRLTFKRVQKFTKSLEKARASGDLEAIERAKRNVERAGQGVLLNSLDDVLAWVEGVRQKWNNHPSRALKKIRDPITGRAHHQTPQEALAEHIANGWQPVALTDGELIELFRPHVQKKVTRGVVTPYGGMRFYHPDLWHYEGQPVVVAYDIDDWRHVTVKDMKGVTICVAEFDEAKDGRAKSFREDAEEKRALAQIQRKQKQIKAIKERTPGTVLEPTEPAGRILDITDFLPEAAPVEPERELTLLDFLPVEIPEPVEREMTILDFLPDDDGEETPSYMDTVMMLYGGKDDQDKDDGQKETAEQ